VNEAILEAMRPVNWPLLALVLSRVAGLVMTAPLWSLRFIPTQVRAAIAVLLSLLMLPLVPASAVPPAAGQIAVLAVLAELLLGLAIGLTAAVFLYSLSIAAEVVSLQMGLSFGAAFGGPADTGSPGIGQLYHQFTLAIYAILGGHVMLVTGLALSFRILPPGVGMNLEGGATEMLGVLGTVFAVAVQVAAPVIVALLITNIALAIVNRAVPQLHTLMVAVPLTVAVGFLVIGVTLPMTAGLVARWVGSLDGGVADLLGSMAPLGATVR
jgi:flagellar biosynthetic protein FliR